MKNQLKSSCALLTLFLCHNPAFAQDAGPQVAESEFGVGDIIVTATKRSESINRVPMTINAATGEQLQQAGVTDVAGLAKIVPGFVAVDSSYGSPVYYLRGVGYFDTTLAAKPAVGVYVDEVQLPYSVMTTGTAFDLERVEVLKGPQGTLFGSNATGGAINYIAAKPTREFEAGVNGEFGRFSNARANAYVSGPLGETLSGRLSVAQRLQGNWQHSTTRDAKLGEQSFFQGRAQLLWQPADNFRANLSFNSFIDKSDVQAAQFITSFQQTPTSVVDPRLATYPVANSAREADWGTTFPNRRDDWMAMGSLRMDYEPSDRITVTSLSSYGRFVRRQGIDTDGTATQLADLFISGDIDTLGQELRVAGDFGKLKFVVGGNYEKSDSNELIDQRLLDSSSARAFGALGPPIPAAPQISSTEYRSIAAFGNVDFSATDFLTFHAGIRYTDTKTDFEGCVLIPPTGPTTRVVGLARIYGLAVPQSGCDTVIVGPPARFGMFAGSLPEDNVSWRVGADVNLGDALLYGNVSRGFKSGSFANLPGSDASQYLPVRQEEVTAYEVGFKLPLADRKVQLNGALFYYDYTDKQLKGRTQVPIFGFLEALVNIPKSRVKGAEFQVMVAPISGLRINAGVTYLDTKITSSFLNFTQFGKRQDFEGRGFSNTPKWQVNADGEYRWAASSNLETYVGGSLTYRSRANADFIPSPLLEIKAHTLIDLRAGVSGDNGNWTLGIFGRNVTNEYYWTTAQRRNDAVIRYAGMPATYGVNFSVKIR